MFTLLVRQTGAALRMLLVATVLLGLAYPLAVWGVSRLPGLNEPAEGSVLTGPDGTPTGSALIGIDPVPVDPAADPYFHTRPSASAEDVLGPGDPSTSGGSNQGGFSDELLDQVQQRRALIAAREGVAPVQVPPDAVTASASGVDPQISPAYAQLQVPRVARVTGLPEATVRQLVADATDLRPLGFLGDPGVNVTRLNLAVAQTRQFIDRVVSGG
jgi:K+-transporting ATPase ATPase C chain